MPIADTHRGKNYCWTFLDTINHVLVGDMIKIMKQSKFFTIVVDESTDLSVTNNLVVFIKFRNKVRESIVGFL